MSIPSTTSSMASISSWPVIKISDSAQNLDVKEKSCTCTPESADSKANALSQALFNSSASPTQFSTPQPINRHLLHVSHAVINPKKEIETTVGSVPDLVCIAIRNVIRLLEPAPDAHGQEIVAKSITEEEVKKRFRLPKNINDAAATIEKLDLSNLIVTPIIVQHLATLCPNVTQLDLSAKKVLLQPNEKWINIPKRSRFKGFNLNQEMGKAIGQFQKLKTLILPEKDTYNYHFFEHLPTEIETLDCTGISLTPYQIEIIFDRLKKLQELDIPNTEASSACLEKAPKTLHKLKVSIVTPYDDEALKSCFKNESTPNLNELEISSESGMPASDGTCLQSAPQSIRKLKCTSPVTDENLSKGLHRLEQLEELNLANLKISSPTLQNVSQNLSKFSCHDASLKDDLLKQILEKATKLVDVDISNTRITGEGLLFSPKTILRFNCSRCFRLPSGILAEALLNMPNLKELDISYNRGTMPLEELINGFPKSLQKLIACGYEKEIDDATVSQLRKICPNLIVQLYPEEKKE